MKIKYLLTIVIIVVCMFSTKVKSQTLEQGNSVVDAYYGYGILTKATVLAITNNSTVKVSSKGPIGMKYEYLVHNNISVGVDGNYSQNQISWTDTDSVILSTSNTYDVTRTIVRFMPRISGHFYPGDNIDLIVGVSLGYRYVKYKIETTDPLFTKASLPGTNPVAFRMSVGGRYFINKFVGLNVEFGLGGGSIICGGISFRF